MRALLELWRLLRASEEETEAMIEDWLAGLR